MACLVAGALGGILLASPASGARPLPSWAEYRGEQAIAGAWRAIAEHRPEDAVVEAKRATELRPDDVEAWHVRCRAAVGVSDWATALESASTLGRAAIELGDRDLAHQSFTALDGLQPSAPGPRVGLALVAARLDGNDAAAVAHLELALARDPSLDLSGLLLRPDWQPLASDGGFVQALGELLRR